MPQTEVNEYRLDLPEGNAQKSQLAMLIAMLSQTRQHTLEKIASVEDLSWSPHAGVESALDIIGGLMSEELNYVWEYFGGAAAPDHYWSSARKPPSERESLLADLEAVRAGTVRNLEYAQDSALQSLYHHPHDGSRPSAQGRWILCHILENEAAARGKIELLLELARAK